jgi:hypothetical protein
MPSLTENTRRNFVPPVLALAGVASLIFGLHSTGVELSVPRAELAPVDGPINDEKTQLITLSDLQPAGMSINVIAERTLFLQERTPWRVEPIVRETVDAPPIQDQPAPEAIPEKLPTPEITLLGIIREQAQTRVLVTTPNMTTEAWKTEGDLIEGWIIDEIMENGMSLHLEGDQLMVNFNR